MCAKLDCEPGGALMFAHVVKDSKTIAWYKKRGFKAEAPPASLQRGDPGLMGAQGTKLMWRAVGAPGRNHPATLPQAAGPAAPHIRQPGGAGGYSESAQPTQAHPGLHRRKQDKPKRLPHAAHQDAAGIVLQETE